MVEDKRPDKYRYYEQLKDHVGGEEVFFDGRLVYPRQLEIHLPADHKAPCVMHCLHCQGGRFEQGMGNWEQAGLSLLHKLKGRVPFHVYGGAYTEPVTNPYLGAYLGATKYYGNHFGIHTSGSPLWELEEHTGLLTEVLRIATDDMDYISFSLDAGSVESHKKGKRLKEDRFTNILKAIELLAGTKGRKLSVRMCYLFNRWNSSIEEIEFITNFAREAGVDSLRFSIPYAQYGQTFDKVEKYKNLVEVPNAEGYRKLLEPFVSTDFADQPYIFYLTPEEGYTDIALYDFNHCIYGYYQITLAADGYLYKCSAVAAPDMKHLRLGKVTDDIEDFERAILENFDEDFDAQECCFKHGARCNRMACESNRKYRDFRENENV